MPRRASACGRGPAVRHRARGPHRRLRAGRPRRRWPRSCSASSWPRSTPPSTGRRRPLPEPWLRYAALDVEVLVDLRDALEGELERQGKFDVGPRGVRRRPRPPSPPAAGRPVAAHQRHPPAAQPPPARRRARAVDRARRAWPASATSPPAGCCPTRAIVAARGRRPRRRRGAAAGCPAGAARPPAGWCRCCGRRSRRACAEPDSALPVPVAARRRTAAGEPLARPRPGRRGPAAAAPASRGRRDRRRARRCRSRTCSPPTLVRRLVLDAAGAAGPRTPSPALCASAGARRWQVELTAAVIAAARAGRRPPPPARATSRVNLLRSAPLSHSSRTAADPADRGSRHSPATPGGSLWFDVPPRQRRRHRAR